MCACGGVQGLEFWGEVRVFDPFCLVVDFLVVENHSRWRKNVSSDVFIPGDGYGV